MEAKGDLRSLFRPCCPLLQHLRRRHRRRRPNPMDPVPSRTNGTKWTAGINGPRSRRARWRTRARAVQPVSAFHQRPDLFTNSLGSEQMRCTYKNLNGFLVGCEGVPVGFAVQRCGAQIDHHLHHHGRKKTMKQLLPLCCGEEYLSNKASGVQSITVPDGDLEESGAELGAAKVRIEKRLVPARLQRRR